MGVGAFIVCRLPPRARPPLRHFAAICALTLLGCAAASAATRVEPWRIDAAHTSIAFRVDAVGFPQTRGHFTRYSGRILLDFERRPKASRALLSNRFRSRSDRRYSMNLLRVRC